MIDKVKLKTIFGKYRPVQHEKEITNLLRHLEFRNVKTILEIGCGGTLKIWDEMINPEIIVGVDIEDVVSGFDIRSKFVFVKGDSSDNSIIEQVKSSLGSRQVDFLFIDANHEYDKVKLDYSNYSPMVRMGGTIAFHDILQPGPSQLWSELVGIKHSIYGDMSIMGIGVMVV